MYSRYFTFSIRGKMHLLMVFYSHRGGVAHQCCIPEWSWPSVVHSIPLFVFLPPSGVAQQCCIPEWSCPSVVHPISSPEDTSIRCILCLLDVFYLYYMYFTCSARGKIPLFVLFIYFRGILFLLEVFYL